jgi:hypothetical protein
VIGFETHQLIQKYTCTYPSLAYFPHSLFTTLYQLLNERWMRNKHFHRPSSLPR